jgi:Ca2+-binding RTX toxin-like protein
MADITGTPGDDVLSGGADSDRITGLDGNDVLAGLDGNDDLNGGPGNDIAVGGRGSDTVAGEAGNDIIVWNNGDGSDLMDGGADADTQVVNGAVAQGDEFRADTGADDAAVFQRVNLIPFTLTMDNVETLDVRGLGGGDEFTVTDLSGTDIEQVVFRGGDGNDLLDAGAATTPILAFGENGDDTLGGGSANDLLSGGDGEDTIVFARGSGIDTVLDFHPGEDSLELRGFGDTVPLEFRSDDGSLVLDFGEGDLLVLNGVGDALFG